ncbi:hypothetical protein Cantr_05563 [Candida viswanathii]|uniref:Uncharacterized protein n=1 Tax=Candida viswanathii TaxID=5486 RepID=A0A367XQ03_9ASCO|nr:hypothetical protein Cantr_05563 [Candida viswanathii]
MLQLSNDSDEVNLQVQFLSVFKLAMEKLLTSDNMVDLWNTIQARYKEYNEYGKFMEMFNQHNQLGIIFQHTNLDQQKMVMAKIMANHYKRFKRTGYHSTTDCFNELFTTQEFTRTLLKRKISVIHPDKRSNDNTANGSKKRNKNKNGKAKFNGNANSSKKDESKASKSE